MSPYALLALVVTLFMGNLPMGSGATPSKLQKILQKPVIDNDDRNALFYRGLDDPKSLMRELFQLWNRPSSEPESVLLKARVGWLIAVFGSDSLKEDPSWDFLKVMQETIVLVERESLPVSLDELRFLELQYQADSNTGQPLNIENELLTLAGNIKDRKMKAFALSCLAAYLVDRGIQIHPIAALLNEVQQLLDLGDHKVEATDVNTLSFLSLTLQSMGQEAEAARIDSILNGVCQAMKIRNFCSGRYYEIGRNLIVQDASRNSQAAIGNYQKALELAQQLNDPLRLARSYYGLSYAYAMSKDHKKAIEYGYRSVEIYEKLNAMDWAASALGNIAASFLADHNPKEALAAGKKALELCPPEFKIDQMKLYKLLSDVYVALGDFAAAHRHLSLYVTLEQATSAEDANKKYMKLRNESLLKQNDMQEEQIKLLKMFRVASILAGGLALSVCIALVIVRRQATQIRRSRQKMKEVLDHIDEGIVILDRNLHILSGYSPYLDTIFQTHAQALDNADLLELLFPKDLHADRGILIRETLNACIGEKILTWDLNSAHLPHEIPYQDMVLAIHWQPLVNPNQLIFRFLISIRDITEMKVIESRMELEAQRIKSLQEKLEEVLGGKIALIRNLMGDFQREFPELHQHIMSAVQQPLALRRLHTWKGAARTLGLKHLASSIHEMESRLIPSSGFNPAEVEAAWEALKSSLEDYEHLLNTILVSQQSEGFAASDLYAYANLYSKEMRDRLTPLGCPQRGVMVMDHVQAWQPAALVRIHEMLLHAVSNALDHGFIRPLQKQKTLKAPAWIQIQAFGADESIVLSITDNGAGIAWDQLRSKAAAMGFTPKPEQSLTDLLFMDGISTAESTTETSGRGVGLSAIRSLCLELGGRIVMEDAPESGTLLRLEFPLASVTLQTAMAGVGLTVA